MTRSTGGLVALATALLLCLVVAGPTTAVTGPSARTVRAAVVADPLTVTLDLVRPAVLPARGPLVLRGAVTNASAETWTDVAVYPFLDATPITSAAALAAAAATATDQVPGQRRLDAWVKIARLDPGASAPYTLRLTHADLSRYLGERTPGVYRLGVQALGADAEGRDKLADGRAYTFLPLAGRRTTADPVALVVPVRRPVNDNRDGQLRGAAAWVRQLQPGGRLADLLAFGEAAPAGQLTWLVDPAVLDAVRRLSSGNPSRTLTTTAGTTSPSSGPSTTATADDDDVLTADVRRQAADWLDGMLRVLRRDTVLALPWGDLDVAGASLRDPAMVQRAGRLSATYFSGSGVTARPAVAAPSGWLKPASLATFDASTTVLATSDVAADSLPAGRVPPPTAAIGAHTVDLYDASASAASTTSAGPLALRQRLLADAVLRARRGTPAPLVVSLPAGWDPGTSAGGLFAALRRPWLRLTPLPEVGSDEPPTVPVDDLVYPGRELASELPARTFTAGNALFRAGRTLQGLLVGPSTVDDQVLAQTLSGLSYDERDHPARSAGRARSSVDRIFDDLHRVTVSAPDFVTLSSASGNRFRVDLSNSLPVAVRVELDPVVDAGLEIGTPGVITIEGGARSTALLTARSERLGYHLVDLQLTTSRGLRIGSGAQLPVRSSQTGRIIWVIIAAGAALLFGAIAVRLTRRFRRHRLSRRTPGRA